MKNRSEYDVVVVGGGAAGFFGALSASFHQPNIKICILEKSTKVLSKVKVSGGGRCNITHACFDNADFIKNYPRGGKELKIVFKEFDVNDTIKWFESKNISLKIEADGRMFPTSNNSQTIIDCFLSECKKHQIEVLKTSCVTKIERSNNSFCLSLVNEDKILAKKILITTGGNPKSESYEWIHSLGHSIENPVPSLFTFNIADSDLISLQGILVSNAIVKIVGTKLFHSGPLLITHWGLSGPVILKLSAWGARVLRDLDYKFKIHINWTPHLNDEGLKKELLIFAEKDKKKKISTNPYFDIPKRLWQMITYKAEIEEDRRWIDISKKQFNKLMESLLRSEYEISGKTTFKEEFVTCGGVKLNEVDMETMESKKIKGVFFGGEVLDIDGITGGFNFQSAWSTGWIAGKNIVK